MLSWEMKHAKEAEQGGIYVTYYSKARKKECSRVGSSSRCFCGHFFQEHKLIFTSNKQVTSCLNC